MHIGPIVQEVMQGIIESAADALSGDTAYAMARAAGHSIGDSMTIAEAAVKAELKDQRKRARR